VAEEKEITGRIILVQEERFRMVDSRGRSFLFDLSHRAPVTNEDLISWSKAKTWLVVEYEGEPEMESGIAHSVKAV
jgi:hypothetical protein